jgi:hypothetical protein
MYDGSCCFYFWLQAADLMPFASVVIPHARAASSWLCCSTATQLHVPPNMRCWADVSSFTYDHLQFFLLTTWFFSILLE